MKNYRVVFEYEGREPSKFLQPSLERLFVTGYNLYCTKANEHIETYNSEYTGPDDGDNPDGEYNKYMSNKLSTIARNVYKLLSKTNLLIGGVFSGFTVEGPDVLFKAILRNGTKMYFYLKET